MLDVYKTTEFCRYSDNLEAVVNNLGGIEILRLTYESDYQGYVDIDVLLSDGRVFSYYYSYGSCSGCDDWEDRDLDDDAIEAEMLQESTIFSSRATYDEWITMKKTQL